MILTCFLLFDSRRLWKHVTKSLKDGNIDEATEHKHRLEERQRGEEKQRAADNKPWKPKYFTKEVQKNQRPCQTEEASGQRSRRSWSGLRVERADQTSLCLWNKQAYFSKLGIFLHQGEGWMYIHPLWKATWRQSAAAPSLSLAL